MLICPTIAQKAKDTQTPTQKTSAVKYALKCEIRHVNKNKLKHDMENQQSLIQQGTLHKVFDTTTRGDKGFKTREFVLEIEGKYPQLCTFQLTQERCDLISAYTVGAKIEVHFDLRGREWNGKYLTNLSAWKIVGLSTSEPTPEEPTIVNINPTQEAIDDLPF